MDIHVFLKEELQLKDVMRDYGYLEHMGMGVPRKIVKLILDSNKKIVV